MAFMANGLTVSDLCQFETLYELVKAHNENVGIIDGLWHSFLKDEACNITAAQMQWAHFWQDLSPLLRRPSPDWPLYRIVFQAAMEWGTESDVRQQAIAWFQQHNPAECEETDVLSDRFGRQNPNHWVWLYHEPTHPEPRRRRWRARSAVLGRPFQPTDRPICLNFKDTVWVQNGYLLSRLVNAHTMRDVADVVQAVAVADFQAFWGVHAGGLCITDSATGQTRDLLEDADCVHMWHVPTGNVQAIMQDPARMPAQTYVAWAERAEATPILSTDGGMVDAPWLVNTLNSGTTRAVHIGMPSSDGQAIKTLDSIYVQGDTCRHITWHARHQMLLLETEKNIIAWSLQDHAVVFRIPLNRRADVADSRVAVTLNALDGPVAVLDRIPGRSVLLRQGDTLFVWDEARSRLLFCREEPVRTGVLTIVDHVILLTDDDNLLTLDSRTGELVERLGMRDFDFSDLERLPSGHIRVMTPDARTLLWDGIPGQLGRRVLCGAWKPIEIQKGLLFDWSITGEISLWQDANHPLASLQAHAAAVRGAKVLPGNRIVTWDESGEAAVWGVGGRQPALRMLARAPKMTTPFQDISLQSETVLRLQQGRKIFLWNWAQGQCDYVVSTRAGEEVLPIAGDYIWIKSAEALSAYTHKGYCVRVFHRVGGDDNRWRYSQPVPLCDPDIIEPRTEMDVKGWAVYCGAWTVVWNTQQNKTIALPVEMASACCLGEDICILESSSRLSRWHLDFESISGLEALPNRMWDRPVKLPDGRLVIWSGELHVWDPQKGVGSDVSLTPKKGCRIPPSARMMTLQGQMLAFVQGANMWIANVGAGTSIQLQGHTADIQGVRMVQDETLISWGSDGTLRLWHMGSAAQLKVLDHHIILAGKKTTDTDGLPVIEGCVPLKGGKLLSWVHPGYGMTLCVWTEHGDLITDYPLPEHNSNALRAVQVINNGKVLLETYRRTYAIWHPVDGGDVDTILAETIDWAMPLSSGLVFVAGGVQVGFCSGYDGAVLEANGTVHDAAVVGATELRDGRIVSWDADHVAVVWSASGGLLNKLAGHTGPVQGAVALGADHVITWSLDDTVRIWSQRGRMTLHEVYARKDLWRERPEVAGLVDAELGRPAAPEVIMRHRSGVLGVATGQRGHVGLALNACAPEDRKIMAIGRSGVTIFSPREGLLFLRLMHGLTPLRVDQWVRHYAPSSTEDPAS